MTNETIYKVISGEGWTVSMQITRVFVTRRWFDDSVYIKEVKRKNYTAKWRR